ncbi:hypothetical protein K435DRAFT_783977 [Dendrothele bispora CBS 962.96]|uniref:F-box domain-containing protein n=1 Tax=Dendrothele bispora (strain CBS 962.96) TaxID=1314807 RepID=A0A4S8L643_DENBC|nr:hypothetical protein K435DRAFT_783977 [Dendrothele bispora CBS 962.96]
MNLRRFVYRVPFTDCFPRSSLSHGRRDEVQGRVEILNLFVLISHFNACLEVLELPAEIAPFLVELPYPNLRRMKLEGHIPLLLQRWSNIFSSAPRLRDLEFKVTRAQVEARYMLRPGSGCSEQGYCLFPPKSLTSSPTADRSDPDSILRDEALEQSTVTRLKSIHLSSPCADDGVFRYLSDSLTELCLVAYPLPGILGARWSDAPASELRTVQQMLDVLKVLCLPNVTKLKLAYIFRGDEEADLDCQLVKRIGECFPELEELEMHRYRNLASENAVRVDPLPIIKEGLASIVNLAHIRLNLDYPQRPRYARSRQNNSKAYRAFHDSLENGDAKSIAEALISLQSIGVLFHEDFSTYWDIWGVDRHKKQVSLIGCPKMPVEM